MNLGEVLRATADYLSARGVASPRVDAEHLLARALGLQRIELYTQHDRPLSEAEREAARELVRRRGSREPLAYVLGDWDFRRLTLKTDRRALVPRPETEVVVERCLALLEGVPEPRLVDVGTGTGAIALALGQERPDASVVATDSSPDALALARENARANGLEIELVETDLLAGLVGPFHLVVSNPPYVLPGELERPGARGARLGAARRPPRRGPDGAADRVGARTCSTGISSWRCTRRGRRRLPTGFRRRGSRTCA